jgi:hypothetical protein
VAPNEIGFHGFDVPRLALASVGFGKALSKLLAKVIVRQVWCTSLIDKKINSAGDRVFRMGESVASFDGGNLFGSQKGLAACFHVFKFTTRSTRDSRMKCLFCVTQP